MIDLAPQDDVTPIATDEEDANKSPAWVIRLLSLAFCVTLTAGTLLPVPIDLSAISQQAATIVQDNPTI